MATVAVIGTGTMGSALVRALIKAKHLVYVWNRTPAKSAALRAVGAKVETSFADAVSAAEIVFMCVTNYAVAEELFSQQSNAAPMRGRTLVQFSTGSAPEARMAAETMQARNIPYVDGALMAYPSDIAAEHCLVLYSGPEELYRQYEAVFRAFGGRPRWCGADPGIANALDSSLLLFLTSGLLGYIQSAALADAEGVPFSALLSSSIAVMDLLVHAMPDLTKRMLERSFGQDQFTIDGYAYVAKGIRERAEALGLKPGLLKAFGDIFADGQAAGRGSDGLATLFESTFARP